MLEQVEDIMKAENTICVKKELDKILAQYDIPYFLYGICIPQVNKDNKNLIVEQYPDNWMDHYMSSKYIEIDSVFHYSLNNNLPIVWTDQLFQNSRKMREESKDAGLKEGISFPIHSVTGEKGIFSISRSNEKTIEKEAFMLVCTLLPYVHQKIKDLESSRQAYPSLPTLTPREQEVLKWAAIGKTAFETSCILNLAERTVVYHLSNVMQKFNCNNKGQAVAFGLTHKLISL